VNLRVHQFLPLSRANGPGVRAVLWLQGCSLACPGCFNPETHRVDHGDVVTVDELLKRVTALREVVEGITISGGEPLQQFAAVTELLRRIRRETSLSVILFSGYTWDEIMLKHDANGPQDSSTASRFRRVSRFASAGPEFLNYVDVLIAGRYQHHRRLAQGLRGSENKTVHLLTSRYTLDDLEQAPAAEVIVGAGGEVSLSGIDPVRWKV